MITSIYQGGLGNQIFQVVVGYIFAKEHNDNYAINPALHSGNGQGFHLNKYLNTIFKNIDKTNHKSSNYYKEPQFNYSEIPYKEDSLLEGYFQTEKYFLNRKKEINQLLEFECSEEPTNECVIHIRTGDYLILSNFNVVTPNYFNKAINEVIQQNSKISFKVISDNHDIAKTYLPKDLFYEFVSSDELNDLKTLSQCDYAIISNSSFSWWGSYLGKSKITYAPNKWFNNINYDVSDVYREGMIKIEI
jgi:hypothetical protein